MVINQWRMSAILPHRPRCGGFAELLKNYNFSLTIISRAGMVLPSV
jgi:hypothetical protein